MTRKAFHRSVALLLLLSLVFALFACSPKGNDPETPEYSGKPYSVVNGNRPYFTEEEITTEAFESYAPLDGLGRCGVAFACIGRELMPTEEREGSLSSVTPTGWINVQYDIVSGGYLYNRAHLIGWQLTAETTNERNLITGTRYLNVDGMLPFENMVAAYIKETDNHVMYRATPDFEGTNLLASGVLMEAYSVEDDGDGICFCVYVYNKQPGVLLNYATGESKLDDGYAFPEEPSEELPDGEGEYEYVLNTSSKKIHIPDCYYAESMKDPNREYTSKALSELLADGYSPCSSCMDGQ